MRSEHRVFRFALLAALAGAVGAASASAQLTDLTQTPNAAKAGIHKSFVEEVGAGRGDLFTPNSSLFVIGRDPFRAVVRGRQLFQRKFNDAQGVGPRHGDGIGDIAKNPALGAGLSDSCASCHGRPQGSAGSGGDVFTRPESRDAPHLFGLGVIEMLGDEITADLRAEQRTGLAVAQRLRRPVTVPLVSKGLSFGSLVAGPDGRVHTALVVGVDADLRVKPFFAQGSVFSMREFLVGALNAEMGLQAVDPDLLAASRGVDVVTPAGLRLSGSVDAIGAPAATDASADPDQDGVVNEIPTSAVDYLEFYLLNYFTPGLDEQTDVTRAGLRTMDAIGCTSCHVQDLPLARDRRVASVQTVWDPAQANSVFSHLFATATPQHGLVDDGSGLPPLQPALGAPTVVHGVFADFKRHDLGPAFHERNFDGSIQTQFMTEPLWGVSSSSPYGHDGRSATLDDVILRHGGEAQVSRDAFVALPEEQQEQVIAFLRTLVLFSPPYTASNLAPANVQDPKFPMIGAGAIDLSPLFVDPTDKE
jgi:Di-haem oxidoreductase, putative peroxidase